MSDSTKSRTKNKILATAHKLFAQKGVHAVGIREIAKEAGVNIAAINYHFLNKENLYHHTIERSIQTMTDATTKIYSNLNSPTTEALSIEMFKYFVSDIDNLKTAYKLFLDTQTLPEMMNAEDDVIGPPGGRFFFETLKQETASESQDDIIWAVRSIFSLLLHKALMVGNKCVSEKYAREGNLEKTIMEDIIRLIKIIKEELKTPRYPF